MNKRTIVLIGLLLELIAVFAVFLQPMWLLAHGTRATLVTAPVDPRSILRGDYVTLDYEAARGLPVDWDYSTPVFVVLKQNSDVYERVNFTKEKPTLAPGEICIRATPGYGRAYFTDIGQYFVPENTGHDFEQAQRTHRLLVDVATDSSCRAGILGLRIGAEAPLENDQGAIPGLPPPVSPAPQTKPAPVR